MSVILLEYALRFRLHGVHGALYVCSYIEMYLLNKFTAAPYTTRGFPRRYVNSAFLFDFRYENKLYSFCFYIFFTYDKNTRLVLLPTSIELK